MSTPSHPLSSAPLANAGPSRTVLQKLLEEIHGSATPTVLRDLGTSHTSPKHHRESIARPPSVWIGGAPIAQDARKKLWAADEARLRKTSEHSIDGATDGRPLLSSQRPLAPLDVPASKGASGTQEPDPSPALNSVIFDGSATAPTVGVPKARTKSLASISTEKRELSPSTSPEILPKKQRTQTMPLPQARKCSLSEMVLPTSMKDGSSDDNQILLRSATFTERASAQHRSSIEYSSPGPSSFRPDIATPQGIPTRPVTPRHGLITYVDSPSPTPTPIWMKPLHLVDNEKSIFMNVHGEDDRPRALCLHCFRQHGNFHRIRTDGCEVCGREEFLKDHYWEPNWGPLMERE